MARWCDRCANDHDEMHVTDTGPGCIYVAMMMSHMPVEAMIASTNEHERWACLGFRRCSCDRGPDDPPGEPPPAPVDPNQAVLFDADALAPGVPRGVWLDSQPVLAGESINGE